MKDSQRERFELMTWKAFNNIANRCKKNNFVINYMIQFEHWLNNCMLFFFCKKNPWQPVASVRNASRQIGANPNSISFDWGEGGVVASTPVSSYERRFMFAKCVLHDDAWGGGCSGAARAGMIGSHPAFPGGGPAEFVGTPNGRRDGERSSATNITLFLDRGVPREERGGGSAGLMHPFA